MHPMLLLSIVSLLTIVKAAKKPFKENHANLASKIEGIKYTIKTAAYIYAERVESRFDAPRVKDLIGQSSYASAQQAFWHIKIRDHTTDAVSLETTGKSMATTSSVPLPSPCLEGLIQNHLPTIATIKAVRDEKIRMGFRSARVQPYINRKGEVISWTDAFKYVFMTATGAALSASSKNSYRRAFDSVVAEFYKHAKMYTFIENLDNPQGKRFRQQSFALCKKDTPAVISYNDHTAAPGFLDFPRAPTCFNEDNGMILAYFPEKHMFYLAYLEGIKMDAFKSISGISPSVRDFKLENHPAFFEAFFKKRERP